MVAFVPLSSSFPLRKPRSAASCRTHGGVMCSTAHRDASSLPAFGLAEASGLTGTLAANLYGLPILGRYGWILNSWRLRDKQLDFPVAVQIENDSRRLVFSFESAADYPKAKTVPGIVTGNYNVSSALAELSASSTDTHTLTFDDKPGKQLRTHVSVNSPRIMASDTETLWRANGLQVASVGHSSHAFQIFEVFLDPNPSAPASKFEYFAVKGIPFPKYTAFIAVYFLGKDEPCVIALDKRERKLECSFVSWKQKPSEALAGPMVSKVAALSFKGAVSDSKCSKLHKSLIANVLHAGLKVRSDVEFRVLVPPTPGVFSSSRENLLVIELNTTP